MRHTLALAVATATWLAAPAMAQVPPPMISVTGEATVSVPPDQAQIDGGVTSDANNAAMGKVLLALKGAGIDEKDYQTSRLSLQPQYAPNRSGPSPVVGYRASNRVTIRLRDVTKAAGVTLGEPLSISEESSPTPVFRGKVASGMAASTAPVAQGEETLSVTV